ncbi:hypothetical protein OIU84_030193 [Salix udensis]|uniref:Uncharacterized protein n=1 Tax=Salix udensis TaxID=889485 RepID=A0AAD6KAZ9_9ROSI|nr:hypothetical protein OIU84_030193 [Salix udensis]
MVLSVVTPESSSTTPATTDPKTNASTDAANGSSLKISHFSSSSSWRECVGVNHPLPRPGMDMDKDKPLVQVKVENPPESPLDNNAFNAFHPRQPQMQFRQQHIAAMSNLHAQSTSQLRQLASLQVPQMQTSNMGMVRAPPVKVEGFQELMGGDAALKHDTEENKLTSPSSK